MARDLREKRCLRHASDSLPGFLCTVFLNRRNASPTLRETLCLRFVSADRMARGGGQAADGRRRAARWTGASQLNDIAGDPPGSRSRLRPTSSGAVPLPPRDASRWPCPGIWLPTHPPSSDEEARDDQPDDKPERRIDSDDRRVRQQRLAPAFAVPHQARPLSLHNRARMSRRQFGNRRLGRILAPVIGIDNPAP